MFPKLEINTEQKKYISKNRIKGSLILNNFTYIGVKSLKLILIGEIENNFNFNNIFVFNELNNIFKTTLNYDFTKDKFVYENIFDNFLLEPCQKRITIDLLIPNIDLPPTYECNIFKIKYKIISIFTYINISNNIIKNIRTEKEIEIVPLIYAFDDKYLNPVILDSSTKINNKIIYGNFSYSVFIPHICYIPGDILNLNLKINNLTNINNYIVLIKMSLKKQLIITHFFDYISNNKIILNYNKKIIHNKNNNIIIKLTDLQIPYDSQYSIFPKVTNNLFEVKYILSINIIISKNNIKIPLKSINIPIVIGSYRNKNNDIDKHPFLPEYKT